MVNTKQKFFLGVDIGKYFHQATMIDSQGLMVGQSIKFNNDQAGFFGMAAAIKKQLPDDAAVYAGMESTGHYYWHLKDYLEKIKIPVSVFNPIETQNLSQTRIRKVKNDRIDSLLIAEITERKNHAGEEQFQPSGEIKQLKDLTRFREKLKGQEKYYKQEISLMMERICPELASNFQSIFLKTPMMLIEEYFIRHNLEGLAEKMKKLSRGKISEKRGMEIIAVLENSIGGEYRNPLTEIELKMRLESLELTRKQLEKIQEEVKKYADNHFKEEIGFISSIKGVSEYIGAVVLSELGDIGRFSSRKKIVAFAGLDPSVKQSGMSIRKQGNHISKRGSKYLRKQLYYAAKTAVIHDLELKEYYLKKKKQGKHYNVILIAVARKILLRIFAVLKQKRPYELRVPSAA